MPRKPKQNKTTNITNEMTKIQNLGNALNQYSIDDLNNIIASRNHDQQKPIVTLLNQIVDLIVLERNLIVEENDNRTAIALRFNLIQLFASEEQQKKLFILAHVAPSFLNISFQLHKAPEKLEAEKMPPIVKNLAESIIKLRKNIIAATYGFDKEYKDAKSKNIIISNVLDVIAASVISQRYIMAAPDAVDFKTIQNDFNNFSQYMNKHHVQACKNIGISLKALALALTAAFIIGGIATIVSVASGGIVPALAIGIVAGLLVADVLSASGGHLFAKKSKKDAKISAHEPMLAVGQNKKVMNDKILMANAAKVNDPKLKK